MTAGLVERARDGFRRHFGREPGRASFAPGRVNLIGEHTDYNEGFVLPCAIESGTAVVYDRHERDELTVVALDEAGEPMDRIALSCPPDRLPPGHWANHARGIVAAMQQDGVRLRGMEMVIAGDVPRGAGLSSSASLGVALLLSLTEGDPAPLWAGQRAQWSEHQYVGCQCGIMDPLVAAAAQDGHALLIDCGELTWRSVAVPEQVGILIAHSGVSRALADAAYNQRREECERAARRLGATSLREVDLAALGGAVAGLDDVAARRARHVVSENQRTLAAATALAEGDLHALGALLRDSHASLRDDFEVTVPAVDALVERLNGYIQTELGGAGGVRMTGGGFGGCVVALVPVEGLAGLDLAARRALAAAGVADPLIVRTQPGAGMRRIGFS
ncbi:MAG: galactokinase [Steroidobacteraceae bacterium]